jgi:membrane-associated protein
MVWTIVLTLVFIECAFIIGLFLPGDSLLFTAGVVLAQRNSAGNAWALAAAAVGVAVAGNMVGYYIGRRTGTSMVGRPGARVLTTERLVRAQDFLDRHGWWSVVLARWIPWIRTLAPLIAGAARMNPRRFMLSTFIGAIAWVPALVIAGYYGAGLLGHFPWVRTTVTLLGIVFFVVGTGYGVLRYRQEISRTNAQQCSRPVEVTADN